MSLHRYSLLGTTPTSFTANDTGVGVEACVVGVAGTDTATGTELAQAPLAVEVGTAVDVAVRPIELFDTAYGDDLYGTPPIALHASVATEAGTLAENTSLDVRGNETGTRTETATLTVVLEAADVGAGDDASAGQNWSASDTATGVELAMAPLALEAGTAVEVIDREFATTDSAVVSEAQGDRAIELFDTAVLEEDVRELGFIVFDDGLALDEATWGQEVADTAVATDEATGGREAFDDYTAVDVATLTASLTAAETGEGDEVFQELASSGLSGADAGTGSAAGTLAATLTLAETATLTETASPGFQAIEFWAGSETVSPDAAVTGAETGSLLAEIGTVAATLAGADAATGSDATTLTATHTVGEAGTLLEAGSPTFGAVEFWAGSEAATPIAAVTCAETGTTAAESGTIVATIPTASDTGSGSDAATLAAAFATTDAATLDQTTAPGFGVAEFWSAADTLIVGQNATETGTATDTAIAPLAEDVASGSETVLFGPSITDTGYGVDTSPGVAVAATVDTATGLELALMGLTSDVGTASDAAYVSPTALDDATGSESGTVIGVLPTASDVSGTIYEITTLTAMLPGASDAGTAADAGVAASVHGGAETGTLSESCVLAAVQDDAPVDEAEGLEEATLEVALEATDDESSGSTAAFWLPAGAYTVPVPLKDTDFDREFDVLG